MCLPNFCFRLCGFSEEFIRQSERNPPARQREFAAYPTHAQNVARARQRPGGLNPTAVMPPGRGMPNPGLRMSQWDPAAIAALDRATIARMHQNRGVPFGPGGFPNARGFPTGGASHGRADSGRSARGSNGYQGGLRGPDDHGIPGTEASGRTGSRRASSRAVNTHVNDGIDGRAPSGRASHRSSRGNVPSRSGNSNINDGIDGRAPSNRNSSGNARGPYGPNNLRTVREDVNL